MLGRFTIARPRSFRHLPNAPVRRQHQHTVPSAPVRVGFVLRTHICERGAAVRAVDRDLRVGVHERPITIPPAVDAYHESTKLCRAFVSIDSKSEISARPRGARRRSSVPPPAPQRPPLPQGRSRHRSDALALRLRRAQTGRGGRRARHAHLRDFVSSRVIARPVAQLRWSLNTG
jgi:hypothetical protein